MNAVRIDMEVRQGDGKAPIFVFVHGLGMSSTIWTSPADAQMAGGLISLRSFMNTGENHTVFHDVVRSGATAVTWDQKRPVGPASIAAEELVQVTRQARELPGTGIVLVCHSRGGLIARLAMDRIGAHIAGLVTICAPHSGSGLARWAEALSPTASALLNRISDPANGRLLKGIEGMLEFIASPGAIELLPGSELMRSLPPLPKGSPKDLRAFSIGGTDPSVFRTQWLSMPERVARLFPDGVIPDELVTGKGDGLVTASSARLEGAIEHRDFPEHHLYVLIKNDVRQYLLSVFRDNFGLGC